MDLRTKGYIAAGCVASLAVAFASGRYSVQAPEIKTQINQEAKTDAQQDKDTHTQTKIVQIKEPSGAVETTTTIDRQTISHSEQQQIVNTQVTQTVIPPKVGTLNLSVLYGTQIGSNFGVPNYGLSVTKSVLGPVTVGAYGFSNGMVGVTVGVNF